MTVLSEVREIRVQELVEHEGARYWRMTVNGCMVRWDYDSGFMFMPVGKIEELEAAYAGC